MVCELKAHRSRFVDCPVHCGGALFCAGTIRIWRGAASSHFHAESGERLRIGTSVPECGTMLQKSVASTQDLKGNGEIRLSFRARPEPLALRRWRSPEMIWAAVGEDRNLLYALSWNAAQD